MLACHAYLHTHTMNVHTHAPTKTHVHTHTHQSGSETGGEKALGTVQHTHTPTHLAEQNWGREGTWHCATHTHTHTNTSGRATASALKVDLCPAETAASANVHVVGSTPVILHVCVEGLRNLRSSLNQKPGCIDRPVPPPKKFLDHQLWHRSG
jgi:hypothetical protein